AALRAVPSETLEAARGLGMSAAEVRRRVAWPLALPFAFAGIRIAAVEVVASATLAAFIGGGGLGDEILNGLAGNDTGLLLQGAVAVALLAMLTQGALGLIERRLLARQQA
ncbi:MAG: ABC transporter permease, partial [Vulcanimicrobiaceae bacterium]